MMALALARGASGRSRPLRSWFPEYREVDVCLRDGLALAVLGGVENRSDEQPCAHCDEGGNGQLRGGAGGQQQDGEGYGD